MASRTNLAGSLVVALSGVVVGVINRDRVGNLSFRYGPDANPRTPLTPALPVTDRTFRTAELEPLLAGLLPDNEAVRRRWAFQFKSGDTPFDLLGHRGLDCVGAIQFARPEDAHLITERSGSLRPVTRSEIAERLRTLRASDHESGWTLPHEQWSLPGAQGKFTLARTRDGVWNETTGAIASTHIIKPGIVGLNHQAAVEFATTRAASRLGMVTTKIDFDDFEGQSAVVIERFDRRFGPDGDVLRLHHVDLCMAAGVAPSRKYERDGGPRAAALAALIRRHTVEADVVRFSDALIFNYLSNSPDAHSKNFSLLFGGSRVRLSPFYDMATGLPYGKEDAATRSAFSIGGVSNFGEAYAKHWTKHAQDFGLDVEERLAAVIWFAERIPDALRDALQEDLGGEIGRTLWRRMSSGPGRIRSMCERVPERIAAGR